MTRRPRNVARLAFLVLIASGSAVQAQYCWDSWHCGPGYYCKRPPGVCWDDVGVCAPLPDYCFMLYAPVCGCDGWTYGNGCEAARWGVNVMYDGPCEPSYGSLDGDCDLDGDTDLNDFQVFVACFNGPNRPASAFGCEPVDFEGDSDVDLTDFVSFQACFNGPNRMPACW